jgi:hypothetical protein
MKRKKILATAAGVVAAGVVAGGVSIAVPSLASSSSPAAGTATASPSPSSSTARHHLRRRRRLRVVGVHGSAKVRTKTGYRWYEWQRGTITSVSSGTLTVRSVDGTTWIWVITSKTHVRVDGAKSAASSLATGDKVGVAGTDGGNRTALRVVVPKAQTS